MAPAATDPLRGATLTVIKGNGTLDVTVTVAEADTDESAFETAVTETLEGFGTALGAVKRPEVEILPTTELPPVAPSTFQVTAVLELPFTVAVNCCV